MALTGLYCAEVPLRHTHSLNCHSCISHLVLVPEINTLVMWLWCGLRA